MSMSTTAIGFRPPDEKWKKMKAVYDACEKAGTEVPSEVDSFFDGMPPDNAGIEVDLEKCGCCKEYRAEMRDGFEIEIAKLPKNITIIRFYNSY